MNKRKYANRPAGIDVSHHNGISLAPHQRSMWASLSATSSVATPDLLPILPGWHSIAKRSHCAQALRSRTFGSTPSPANVLASPALLRDMTFFNGTLEQLAKLTIPTPAKAGEGVAPRSKKPCRKA
ncbi:MAG: hypothetical protein IPO31_20225 [Candidatus Obscuribacter sp.]|nr:hypothetical protein [Candidatus Obscuribacter sp.]